MCPTEQKLSAIERYRLLLGIALTHRLGRPLALLCALIELRYAELHGDLVVHESGLRAMLDLLSTRASGDVLFEAVTRVH